MWFLLAYLVLLTIAVGWQCMATRRIDLAQAALDKKTDAQQVASLHRFNCITRMLRLMGKQAGWGDDLELTQQFDPHQSDVLRKETGPRALPEEVPSERSPGRVAALIADLGVVEWLVIASFALSLAVLLLALVYFS